MSWSAARSPISYGRRVIRVVLSGYEGWNIRERYAVGSALRVVPAYRCLITPQRRDDPRLPGSGFDRTCSRLVAQGTAQENQRDDPTPARTSNELPLRSHGDTLRFHS